MNEAMQAWIGGFASGVAISLAVVYCAIRFREMREEDEERERRARNPYEWPVTPVQTGPTIMFTDKGVLVNGEWLPPGTHVFPAQNK